MTMTNTRPPSVSNELQSASIALQPVSFVHQQDQQPAAFDFLQHNHQAIDLMANDIDTHMISNLNWISPSFEFDISNFDYDPMETSQPDWPTTTQELDVQPTPQRASIPQGSLAGSEVHPTTGGESATVEHSGITYVDDTGARRPRNGRYANQIFNDAVTPRSLTGSVVSPAMVTEPESYSFLPNAQLETIIRREGGLETDTPAINVEQYQALTETFQDLCLTPSVASIDPIYITAHFPSIATLDTLLGLYRCHFDGRVLPLYHSQAISDAREGWINKLAMAAIGSQYVEMSDSQLSVPLHEFLRRVLQRKAPNFSSEHLTPESLSYLQAKFLNYIGMAYSGSKRLERHRSSALDSLVSDFLLLYGARGTVLRGGDSHYDSSGWQNWIFLESARRILHSIWLLDNMSRYHFDTNPRLLLDYGDITLPCKESLWQAGTVQGWREHMHTSPTLEKALGVLYIEKWLLKGVGDFARVLLIHGLYCQTWDIARSVSRPLARWTPSANKGSADSQELTGPSWLPKIPLYNQWRNSACDCLDVLHWIANSDIAKSGTENTTVLNLHFARIVLLTPYQAIRELARLLIDDHIHVNRSHELFKQCQVVRRWITEDQFKARLALVHCGVFFWHVRRYSTDAFYEPTNVFMATLVVWAYGSLCPPSPANAQRMAGHHVREEGESLSDLEIISSIRLDRPTDDELVQLFIKRGRTMKATIAGVGKVTAPNGPVRMLREGCKLLSTLDKWPIRQRYLYDLGRLADVCSQDQDWVHKVFSSSRQTQTT